MVGDLLTGVVAIEPLAVLPEQELGLLDGLEEALVFIAQAFEADEQGLLVLASEIETHLLLRFVYYTNIIRK